MLVLLQNGGLIFYTFKLISRAHTIALKHDGLVQNDSVIWTIELAIDTETS